MRWYSVLFGLLFTLNAIAETKPAPPLECGDFLKQLGLQRPEIKYISCTRTNSHEPGMDGLTATYQVAGKDIAKVETWLIRFAHAKPLKFNCCGWETNDVTFKGKDDAQYTIGMGGETTESSRKNFSKIPYLTLYVSHYFYEP